jgi:multisubunit Na+/H+ antiporter MnhC subunit
VSLIFALAAASLFGIGAYLVLHRDLVRVVLGVVIISQASVLTLIASGLVRGEAPIDPAPGKPVSDPLSEAMALTAIVIGLAVTALLLTLVFVGVFSRLPPIAADRSASGPQRRLRRRSAVSGVIAGVGAFTMIWAALSRANVGVSNAQEQIRLTPEAHGTDVVTVILADFRGLDTLVEITVLATAIIGVALLLRRGRAW